MCVPTLVPKGFSCSEKGLFSKIFRLLQNVSLISATVHCLVTLYNTDFLISAKLDDFSVFLFHNYENVTKGVPLTTTLLWKTYAGKNTNMCWQLAEIPLGKWQVCNCRLM